MTAGDERVEMTLSFTQWVRLRDGGLSGASWLAIKDAMFKEAVSVVSVPPIVAAEIELELA